MLTLKSPFKDFIQLCVKSGACANTEAIPVMEKANTGIGMVADGTCADGFKLYLEDKSMPESWSPWVLEKVGKELDEDCRKFFIDKITHPMTSLQLLAACDFLTEEEHILVKAKYVGKLPTAEKEIADGKVVLMTAKVK
jgi:hypothetical protein